MPKFYFNIVTLISFLLFSYCQSDRSSETINEPVDLDFELVKTLEYDYLGRAFVIDYSNDLNLVALYDDQRDEIIIANEEEILVQKKLSGDSKNSYGGMFAGASFWKDKLIIFGAGSYYFVYDLDLNLIERVDLPYPNAKNTLGPFTNNLIFNDLLVYYADTKEDRKNLNAPADPVVIWSLTDKTTKAKLKTPQGIPQVWSPGGMGMAGVQFTYSNNDLFVIYPYHPVIYKVDIQNNNFNDSILIDVPTWKMPEVVIRDYDNRIEAAFDDLTFPSFTFLNANDDMIITAYQHGIPKEEVDQLPRNMLGGQKWYELENQYREPKMLVISGNKTVAETNISRGIQTWHGGYKVARWPIGTEYQDVEEDYIRFYFYKPILRAKAKTQQNSSEKEREEND